MMHSLRLSRKPRYGLLSLALLLSVGGGFGYKASRAYAMKESSANYTITYPSAPKGWKVLPHGPQTLFVYQQPSSKVLMTGGINQVIEEFNPTPELGTEALAQNMMDVTRENMPGWTAESLDTVGAQGTSFRLIRRAQKGHVVVNAFAVRGNTTILFTLSGRDNHVDDVSRKLSQFREFLANVKLTRADLSNL